MQKFTEVVAKTTQDFWHSRDFEQWYSTNLSKIPAEHRNDARVSFDVNGMDDDVEVCLSLYYVRDETEEEREVREHKKKAEEKRAWDSAMWTIKVMKERGYVDE